MNAHQRTEALKAAIELEVFTAIGEGNKTAPEISKRIGASEKGTRILCDFLCIIGFLTKQGSNYELTQDSAVFLDKRSPAYLGRATEFLASDILREAFRDFTATVRKGGTTISEEGSMAPEHPMWVNFARAMAPMMAMPAQALARLVDANAQRPLKVLDIAAGHGLFGIAFAQQNPQTQVYAVDWPNVLEVANENAAKAGIRDRFHTISGSAFDVDYGTGFDLALLTNFLHHFDPPTCEKLLRKVRNSLADNGRAVTLEFVPNEDRISPPDAAAFSVSMLASTPGGDAYTYSELEKMCAASGFSRSELHALPPSIQSVVISHK
jgi:SAM-dependent methyltransferase